MAHDPVTIVGNHISPFVRKVLATCEMKGVAYRMDSIVPFYGSDRFTELSPMRRIPVLIEGDVVVHDSTVICEYLEETRPQPALLPRDPALRARARFLDEIADTRIAEILLWKVFGRALVAPAVFKAPRDLSAIEATMRDEYPPLMNLLESWVPAEGFLLDDTPGLADVSVASHFVNFRWARQVVDAARWPRTAAWLDRVETGTPLGALNEIGAKILRCPPTDHAPLLHSLGVTVTDTTVGGAEPRRGPMTVV
jgi:glutathione S-transferase